MFSYQIWYLHGQIRTFTFSQNFAQEGILSHASWLALEPFTGKISLSHVSPYCRQHRSCSRAWEVYTISKMQIICSDVAVTWLSLITLTWIFNDIDLSRSGYFTFHNFGRHCSGPPRQCKRARDWMIQAMTWIPSGHLESENFVSFSIRLVIPENHISKPSF